MRKKTINDQTQSIFFIVIMGTIVCLSGVLHSDNGKEEVQHLIIQLKDSDPSVRRSAASALGSLGEHAKGALPQLVDAVKDSDLSVRTSAAYALGILGVHAKGALPQLAEALKDSDPSVRESAAYALGRLGVHAKGALPQLVDAALKDSNRSVRESLLQALESLRKYLPEEIDRLLREKLSPPTATADLCKVLCGLVDKSNSWISTHYARRGLGYHEKTFGFSLLSLSALFLSKASPFCSAAKPVIGNIIAHLSKQKTAEQKTETSPECPPNTFPFKKLQTLATDVLKMTASPLDSPHVYGKQFLTLFLRDALRRGDITDSQREQVTALLKKTEDSLAHDLKVRPTIDDRGGGSLFNTYALSTVLLTLEQNSDEEIRLLGEAINPDDALRIKYNSDSPFFDSRRGSAARAVPVHLARYVKLPKKERDSARKDLISAVKNYVNHLPSLVAHLQRGATHMGQDHLAPYYLYATIPYQTVAIQLLLEEGKPEEREMLEEMRKKTKSAILSLVRPDGQFYVPEYESSPGYVNPLFGLALIPLANDCAKEHLDKQDLYGILVREIPK